MATQILGPILISERELLGTKLCIKLPPSWDLIYFTQIEFWIAQPNSASSYSCGTKREFLITIFISVNDFHYISSDHIDFISVLLLVVGDGHIQLQQYRSTDVISCEENSLWMLNCIQSLGVYKIWKFIIPVFEIQRECFDFIAFYHYGWLKYDDNWSACGFRLLRDDTILQQFASKAKGDFSGVYQLEMMSSLCLILQLALPSSTTNCNIIQKHKHYYTIEAPGLPYLNPFPSCVSLSWGNNDR